MPRERIQRLLDTADQPATIEDIKFILTLDEDSKDGRRLEEWFGGKALVDPPHPNRTIATLLILAKAKPDVEVYMRCGNCHVSAKPSDLAGKITIGDALNLRRARITTDDYDEDEDLLF